IWLWLLAGLALLLLSGVVAGAVGIRRAGQSARRPVLAALAAGLITTIIAFFLVPGWTLAGFDSLNGPVDYVFALLLA
ncbi:hypothetical protein J8J27_35225, partial [Mycobacterium tuberculosis]|nr:hypothetical protein [Mycobacterium tuberculosis]